MKIDLHTHSIFSPDGGITEKEYEEIIAKKILDVVAITDHNKIDFAQKLNKKLGEHIIIGEEIMTTYGEVIGLFLTEEINLGLSLRETIDLIHSQGGIVYIPHPFETIRHGVSEDELEKNAERIDIIETYNGRAILGSEEKAKDFAKKYHIHQASGSDAHGLSGVGYTYTIINSFTSAKTLLKSMEDATVIYKRPPLLSFLDPKINRFKKFFKINRHSQFRA